MQYLNQSVVYLSEENKQLKEKVMRLERICQNLSVGVNDSSMSYFSSIEMKSPKSCISEQLNMNNKQMNSSLLKMQEQIVAFNRQQSQNKSIGTLDYSKSPLILDETVTKLQVSKLKNQLQRLTIELQQMQNQLERLTIQLQQMQIQSITKSNKISQLTGQLNRSRDQVIYLRKELALQKENLKHYYETIIVKEMQERFESQKCDISNQFSKVIQHQSTQLRQLKTNMDRMVRKHQSMQSEIREKSKKEERMMSLIKQMKHLLQTNQLQYQQQVNLLNTQLIQSQQENQALQQQISRLGEQLQHTLLYNDQLKMEMKKLNKQLVSFKRQHQRSVSKSERQLHRQISLTKNIQKNFQLQIKLLESELRKKQHNEKYHIRQKKQLITKIKTIQNNQQLSGNHPTVMDQAQINGNNSLSLSNATKSKNKSSFTRYLKQSPNSSTLNTPIQSNVNLKSQHSSHLNTPVQSKVNSKPNSSRSVTPSNKLKVKTGSKVMKNKNTHSKTEANSIDKTGSSLNITKKKTNHYQIEKTNHQYQLERTNHNETKKSPLDIQINNIKKQFNRTSPLICSEWNESSQIEIKNSPRFYNSFLTTPCNKIDTKQSIPSLQSIQINNYSQIQLLKDNLSGYPSSKSSKLNSEEKHLYSIVNSKQTPSQETNQMSSIKRDVLRQELKKESFNQHIDELRQLELYMRTSFNPNHILKLHSHQTQNHQNKNNQSQCLRTTNSHQPQYNNKNTNQLQCLRTKNKSTTEFTKRMTTHRQAIPQISHFQLIQQQYPSTSNNQNSKNYTNYNENLINKMHQASQQTKLNQQSSVRTNRNNKPEQIEELLNVTERISSKFTSKNISRKNSQQIFNDVSLNISPNLNQQPILKQLLKNNKISNLTILQPKSTFNNKQQLKNYNLDTPCFQSASNSNSQNIKTNHLLLLQQQKQQTIIAQEKQSPQRNQQNLNSFKDMGKRKKISISIANIDKNSPSTISIKK